MSVKLQPLSPTKQATHGYALLKDFSFAKTNPFSAIFMDEMSALITTYALAFVKYQDKFILVCLQGLYSDENLFLDENGRWITNIIPNIYKTYPFVLADSPEKKNLLCFNMQSGLYRETPSLENSEERFFDDDGKLTPKMEKILALLTNVTKYKELTLNAVEAIAKADILEAWNFKVEDDNREKPCIQGLYRIDEKKLSALSAEELKELQKVHALPIIYAQLLSMSRVALLQQLQNAKNKKQEKKKIEDIDLDAIFGEGSSDTLNFGF